MVRSSIEECCFASRNRDIGTRRSARQNSFVYWIDCTLSVAQILSGARLASIVRASVTAATEAAPAERKALAHSFSVVPVVNTSSMSRTRRPAKVSAVRTMNARRRFRRRSCLVRDVCGSVANVRMKSVEETGRMRCRPKRSAISRDWLNSRARSLEGCNGTGTMRSTSSCSGKARIISEAKGFARLKTFRYLNAQMAC